MALRQLIHLVEHSRRLSWRNERTTARREEEDRPPRGALGGFAVTLSACLRPAASALFWFLIQAQASRSSSDIASRSSAFGESVSFQDSSPCL
jgi:hypothetical protein